MNAIERIETPTVDQNPPDEKVFYYEVWRNKYPNYGQASWQDFEFDFCDFISAKTVFIAFEELKKRIDLVNAEEKSNNVKFKLRNVWEV